MGYLTVTMGYLTVTMGYLTVSFFAKNLIC